MAESPEPEASDYGGAPLVGVTTSEVRVAAQVNPTPEGEPPRPEMALGLTYLRAVEAAGGMPVVIPPLSIEAITPLLERLDGICLSGGPDLDPSEYGQDPHPELGPTWRELDRAELAVAREADARGLPILAICRGAQALNVARSGTLFQHLSERFGARVEHRQSRIGTEPIHRVEVDPESRLAKALGETEIEVNSFHHQAADEIGRGLRAVAFSPDGVVEAIEAPGSRFVLGVQWHAESLTDRPEQARLFRAFVEASRPGQALVDSRAA
ncbi:MAG: gamma-glutamyl-gamma-aminobutyrate hydrolase family protein [Solirubrobacterales bacterium]